MRMLLLISLMICSAGTVAFASNKNQKGNFHKKILSQLNLSQEQKNQLQALKQESKGVVKQLKENKRNKRREMNQALSSDTPENKLIELHNEISQIQKIIKEKRFRKMLAIRKILSAEQRKEFYQFKKKMKKRKRKNNFE